MQVDTDAGTLKFWLDGKPHGPGFASRVTGPLRWATSVYYKSNDVEIVSTLELQPWTPRMEHASESEIKSKCSQIS